MQIGTDAPLTDGIAYESVGYQSPNYGINAKGIDIVLVPNDPYITAGPCEITWSDDALE